MRFEELVRKKRINLSGRDLTQGNRLTDAVLVDLTRVLRESSVLKELHLDMNDITLDNGRDFTDALASNRTLEVLNLSGNRISGQGTEWLADALVINQSLVYVSLSNNNIDENGCKRLAFAFMKNRGYILVVHLSNNEGTDGVSELMKEITRLKGDYSSKIKEIDGLKDALQKCEDDKEVLKKDVAAAKADIDWIRMCKHCLKIKENMYLTMTCGHMICFDCLHQGDKKEMLAKCPILTCEETLEVEQCKTKKLFSMLDVKGSKTYGTRSKRKAN